MPRITALSIVESMVIVFTMSAMIRISWPSRIGHERGLGYGDPPDRRREGGDRDPSIADDAALERHDRRCADDRDLHLTAVLKPDVAAAGAGELLQDDANDQLVRPLRFLGRSAVPKRTKWVSTPRSIECIIAVQSRK